MAVKLGSLLIDAGVITREQLEEGLQAQVMFGGKIGTNLIELGFIGGDFLAQFLAKQLHVPFCSKEELENISNEVIHLFPRELVEKHRAIPVRCTRKEIWVAMMDPSSLPVVDEFAFVTNLKVHPLIAPEAQILDAMERYYHIEKPRRYVQLTDFKGEEIMPVAHSVRDFIADGLKTMKVPDLAKPSRTSPGPGIDYAVQFPKTESAASPAADVLSPLMDPNLPDSLFPLNDIAQVLTEARSKDDIFQAVASPFMEFFQRYAIFINKTDVMVGYDASGEGFSKEKIESIAIPLKVPSVFREAVKMKAPIFGPWPQGHNNQRIASLLSSQNGNGPCLLCPIPLVEKVGVIFYADTCADPESVACRLDKFKKMMTKAGLAFQVLVLKQKILHM